MNLSARQTLELFRAGSDIESIAPARVPAPSTAEVHLAAANESGQDLPIDGLISPARRDAIVEV